MMRGSLALCTLLITGAVMDGASPENVLRLGLPNVLPAGLESALRQPEQNNTIRKYGDHLREGTERTTTVLDGNSSAVEGDGVSHTTDTDDLEAENCVPPSIQEFPRDLFSDESRQSGALVLHFVAVAYLCCALAIVCDEYFVPCLELLSHAIRIPTDVAGATVMAIGTSSPELYSAIIGSFITKGDIGLGTIVGSAVFNILGVTSVTGLCLLNRSVQLEWYPILRDFIIYVVSVALLAIFIKDSTVQWYEATSLLILFALYIAIMFFNAGLKRAANKQVGKVIRLMRRQDDTGSNTKDAVLVKEVAPLIVATYQNGAASTPLHNAQEPSVCDVLLKRDENTELKANGCTFIVTQDSVSSPSTVAAVTTCNPSVEGCGTVETRADVSTVLRDGETKTTEVPSSDAEVLFVPFTAPNGGWLPWAWWLVTWPAACVFFVTVPNCKRFPRLFPATFIMSVLWIGILSYLCAWMVTVIGYTLNVPDSVSGLTILAAGISVPEIITSVLIVNMGFGNMAISNLFGSNILDILFCLGLPWLVKTCATGPLHINSGALTYTTLTLLATTVLMVVTLCAAGWRLNLRVGIVCLLLYASFIVLACLYELNVFGDFNPPTCGL